MTWSLEYDMLIGIKIKAFLLCFLLTWSKMLVVFFPVPADFVYSAQPSAHCCSSAIFFCRLVQKVMPLMKKFGYSSRSSESCYLTKIQNIYFRLRYILMSAPSQHFFETADIWPVGNAVPDPHPTHILQTICRRLACMYIFGWTIRK